MTDDIPNLLHSDQVTKKTSLSLPKNLDELPPLLTVKEVAELLRVSPITIRRWTKRGRLPAIRINSRGDRRYRKETILYYLGVKIQ